MLKLLRAFIKKTDTTINISTTKSITESWHQPLTAPALLDTPLRQQYLATIWQNVSMTPEMFDELYRRPIEKYAEMVQLLPASESHHHSHIGGMLDHGLEVIAIATKLRQSYILPQNSIPEEQAKQRDVWTAVVIYAALLHDIGKCAVDIEIILKDGTRWFPWQGRPSQPYNFRYIKGRDYQLHQVLGGFLANLLIPKYAFDWLAPFPKAFSDLMYFTSGHPDKSGILSEIIQKADQISVTMALGGDPNKLSEKPQISFAKQLSIALIHVIGQFKINAPKGGGEGWLTEEGLWVLSKTTADKIRAYLVSQGVSVPSQNGKIFDELQAYQLIEATEQNTAIWNANIISNTGWAPKTSFTLLKIQPNKIWENLAERPSVFDGQVIVINDNYKENSIANEEDHLSNEDFTPLLPNEALSIEKEETSNENQSNDDGEINSILELFPTSQEVSIIENEDIYVVKNIPTQKIETPEENQKSPSDINATLNLDINEFINWIKTGIISNALEINKPNAKLHIVENHLFIVTPNIFQLFLIKKLGEATQDNLEKLQKQFQTLGLHKRLHTKDDSRNIWTCVVVGAKRKSRLNGYLIENVKYFLGNKPFYNNHWLKLNLQGEKNDV